MVFFFVLFFFAIEGIGGGSSDTSKSYCALKWLQICQFYIGPIQIFIIIYHLCFFYSGRCFSERKSFFKAHVKISWKISPPFPPQVSWLEQKVKNGHSEGDTCPTWVSASVSKSCLAWEGCALESISGLYDFSFCFKVEELRPIISFISV